MNCEKSKNVLSNFLLFRVLQHFDANVARGFLLEAYFYHCTTSWKVDFNFCLRLVATATFGKIKKTIGTKSSLSSI